MSFAFMAIACLFTLLLFLKRAKGYLQPHQQLIQVHTTSFAAQVFIIDNGFIFGCDGDLLSKEKILIPNTSINSDQYLRPGERLLEHHLIRKPFFLWPQHCPLTVAVIAAGASSCYFHWMFDVIPKIHILRQSGLDYDLIYLPSISTSFQKQTLKLLNIDLNQTIQAVRRTQIQARKIIGLQLPTQGLHVPLWVAEFLQKSFIPSSGPTFAKRIYISRQKALKRALANEKELIEILSRYGFIPMCAEDYSITDQAWIFSQAEWIISAHGSGLVNTVFCSSSAKILELGLAAGSQLDCYQNLAHLLGLYYCCISCTRAEEDSLVAPLDAIENYLRQF